MSEDEKAYECSQWSGWMKEIESEEKEEGGKVKIRWWVVSIHKSLSYKILDISTNYHAPLPRWPSDSTVLYTAPFTWN